MTFEEWSSLKVGDIIYSKAGKAREVLKFNNLCVTLKAIRRTKYGDKTTVYSKNDRQFFSRTGGIMKRNAFTLVELIVVVVIVGIILSVGYTSCYKFISREEYTGIVIACEKATNNVYTNTRTNDKTLFSFSCDIKCDNGEIISFSSEDRKFATVIKNDVVKVAIFKYAPWNFDKAGTFYGGRLLKKIKSAAE